MNTTFSEQFRVAMTRFGREDLTIDFAGFLEWYKHFAEHGGQKLLSVNFDASVLEALREIAQLVAVGVTVPRTAMALYDTYGSLRALCNT